MGRETAVEKLNSLNRSIVIAVNVIRSEIGTIEQFLKEARNMDNFGHIVDPTLFLSPERQVTEALLKPVYEAARDLVRVYDDQVARGKRALAEVNK